MKKTLRSLFLLPESYTKYALFDIEPGTTRDGQGESKARVK